MLTEANLEAHDFRLSFAKELLATMEYRRGKAALAAENAELRAKVVALTEENEVLQGNVPEAIPKDSMCEYHALEMRVTTNMWKIDAMIEKADRLLAERRTAKRLKVSEGN